jgi:hypothetical protein
LYHGVPAVFACTRRHHQGYHAENKRPARSSEWDGSRISVRLPTAASINRHAAVAAVVRANSTIRMAFLLESPTSDHQPDLAIDIVFQGRAATAASMLPKAPWARPASR